MISIVLLVLSVTVSLYAIRSVRQYRALRAFGGHWSAGWSRLWLLRTQMGGHMNLAFAKLNQEHGSTARIGPALLITSDPELVRRMNAVRSPFVRGHWYTALKLHPERDNITSYIDERKHGDLRSRMAPGYSGKENHHMEKDIDDTLLQMLQLIERKYLTRPEAGEFNTLDLGRVTSFFTLDVISKIAFGHAFGFLDHDDDPFGYLANLEQFLPAIIVFGVYSELTSILRIPLIKAALPKSTDKRGLGRVMGFAAERVRERFGSKPIVRKDMLGSFIRKGLTQDELESETLTQITAGSDSTASALRLALHYISTSPPILARLLAELRTGIETGKVSRPVIKDAEARELPYLQACIKEGLRIYPPVTGLLMKAVPDAGVMIEVDGVEKFAPAGTQVGWNTWGMMRNPDIFGPDVEIYRPERWLRRDGSEEEHQRVQKMTETVSLCFGYGRFGCLGRGVATMELNKGIAETLLRFNLQSSSLAKPFDEQVVGFYIHNNMNFVATERRSDESKDPHMNVHIGTDAAPIAGAYES